MGKALPADNEVRVNSRQNTISWDVVFIMCTNYGINNWSFRTIGDDVGGFGSGWHRGRKATVEDGITLDLAVLRRHGFLESGRHGTWTWSQSGEPIFSAGIIVDLHIITKRRGEVLRQTIKLEITTPRYGGKRYWFICPRTGKRVRCLHIPPRGREFASRAAYGLGYRSSQTCSASWRNQLNVLAAQAGVSAKDVRRLFKSGVHS